ncbi:MAG TPA: hypothetical protein VF376_13055 [Thermoanaerobaculia bacterium]
MISGASRRQAALLLASLLTLTSAAFVRADEPPSLSERVERLEKLLDQTRADLALAQKAPSANMARFAEVERQIDVLAREIEQLKLGEAATAPALSPAPSQTQVASYGVGPSASKVYATKTGVAIGGYGESLYQNFAQKNQIGEPSSQTDQATQLRAVVYLGYKFDEHFLFNSELEYANAVVASDKNGEAEVEFAYLDYLHSRAANARAGLVLIPMGLVNQLHEPTTFLGARRPDVEQIIIPSTWRELGLGGYGQSGPFSYYGYLVNGLNAARYSAEGIGEGSQEGSEALARNWAFTGRLDYTGTPGLLVGVSFFTGDAGQGHVTPSGVSVKAPTTVWDAHVDWRWQGLWLRGLYAGSHVGQADLVNQLNGFVGDESVGSRQEGWYLQGAFDVLSLWPGSRMGLLPYVRYEQYDTQASVPTGYERNPANDIHELTLGLAFKPIDQLVLKVDWQERRDAAQTGVNQWNFALGYIF